MIFELLEMDVREKRKVNDPYPIPTCLNEIGTKRTHRKNVSNVEG